MLFLTVDALGVTALLRLREEALRERCLLEVTIYAVVIKVMCMQIFMQ